MAAPPASRRHLMEYGTLLIFLAFAHVFVAGGIAANYLLMPRKPDAEKLSTYECGLSPIGEARVRYSLRFYVFAVMYVVFAVMYVVFAVEAAFLLPWAVVYGSLDGFAPFLAILLFTAILLLGLAYAWKKGELKWD